MWLVNWARAQKFGPQIVFYFPSSSWVEPLEYSARLEYPVLVSPSSIPSTWYFYWAEFEHLFFSSAWAQDRLEYIFSLMSQAGFAKSSARSTRLQPYIQDQNRTILPCLGGHTNIMNLPHSCCLCLNICSKVCWVARNIGGYETVHA